MNKSSNKDSFDENCFVFNRTKKNDTLRDNILRENKSESNLSIIKKNPNLLFENIFSSYLSDNTISIKESANIQYKKNITNRGSSETTKNNSPTVVDFLVMDNFNRIYNTIYHSTSYFKTLKKDYKRK